MTYGRTLFGPCSHAAGEVLLTYRLNTRGRTLYAAIRTATLDCFFNGGINRLAGICTDFFSKIRTPFGPRTIAAREILSANIKSALGIFAAGAGVFRTTRSRKANGFADFHGQISTTLIPGSLTALRFFQAYAVGTTRIVTAGAQVRKATILRSHGYD